MSKKKKPEPTKPKIDFKIEKQPVRHNFTPDERVELALECGRRRGEEASLECQL